MMLNGQVVDKGIQDAAQRNPSKDWKAPTFSQLKVGFRHLNGKELATVGNNPVGPGEQAPGPAIQTRLTAGLHKSGTTSCR